MMQGMFGWVDLTVDDLERGQDFYTGLFGWDGDRIESPDGQSDYVIFRKDGKMAAGMTLKSQQMREQGVPSTWNSYVLVADVNAIAGRAAQLGASILAPPMDITDAGRMTFVLDPQGGALGFWQPGTHRGADQFNAPGFLVWNELISRDVAGSKSFYSQLMPEWELSDSDLGGVSYTTIGLGKGVNGSMRAMSDRYPAAIPTHWSVYFAVEDARAGAQRVEGLGGSLIGQVVDSPAGPLARIADPEGAAFRILGPATPSNSVL
jgi:predicted enzyme related to lactoylglutathione lyase